MKAKTFLSATALAAVGALALAGCSSGGGGTGDGDVTMTFWHNSTTGDGKAYWEATVAAFEEANPGVTIEIQSIQNEEMDGKLQTALNSGDAPDIFMSRGGGKLADVVTAGQVMDVTDGLSGATKTALGGVIDAFAIDGKIYGLPTAVLPEGIFYSQDLFDGSRHHREPGDDRGSRGGERAAARVWRAADRARREGRVARRALVLQLRAARLLAGRRERRGREPHASMTRAGRRPATTSPTSPRPTRSTTASSRPLPSRAPVRLRVCSPTTRLPWSSWAPGTRE